MKWVQPDRRRLLHGLAACLGLKVGLATSGAQAQAGRALDPWIVCYHGELRPEPFFGYKLAVFDSDEHPPLQVLAARGIEVLGYISLGEAESGRSWFEAVKADGLLLMENANWPGSFFVDVRNPAWTRRVIEEIIPATMARGFHGIFLDTLDNPPHLERIDPVKFAGMTNAAVRLIEVLRQRFPGIRIMLNRGFELHEAAAKHLDYVLGEAIMTEPDGDKGKWKLASDASYNAYVTKLLHARTLNPALQVMTLDYWMPDDKAGIRKIYARQRSHGFLPYVGTRELDRIVAEPR